MKLLAPLMLIALLVSCVNSEEQNNQAKEDTVAVNYQHIGDSISILAQQTLLANVGREMKAGGPTHAIDFCNLNASAIMDSISKHYGVKIGRITAKARNKSNLANASELELLDALEQGGITDTIIKNTHGTTYYKPIRLGMPACIKCHGVPEVDINTKTLDALSKLYPDDQAKSYKLGDFRGAWKIEFE